MKTINLDPLPEPPPIDNSAALEAVVKAFQIPNEMFRNPDPVVRISLEDALVLWVILMLIEEAKTAAQD